MRFVSGQFKGQVPILAPHLLKDEYSTFTLDCELKRLALRPSTAMRPTNTLFTLMPQTIYPHYTVPLESAPDIETGVFDGWFWFPYKTTAFFSVLPNDKYDRIYFLDDQGQPRITDHDNITLTEHGTGVAGSPSVDNSWKLGVPAPAGAPSGAASGGSSAVVEDRAYVYTFVDRWGAEGPPSPPSAIVVSVKQDASVTVSGMDAFPADYNFTGGKRRIYRAVSGTTRTDYLYVGETTGTSFTDNAPVEKLGEVLPTRTWYPPPEPMEDWVMAPNGALVGFRNNTLYFSMPFLPSAWPPDYQIAINHDIKGLAAVAGGVAVMTNNNPYFISGVIPMSAQPRKLDLEEACINGDAVVTIGNSAYYPSPNGIVEVNQSSARIASDDILTRSQWELFTPEAGVAVNYADTYLMFYDSTGHTFSDAEFLFDRNQKFAPVKGAMSMESNEYLQFWSDFASAPVLRPHDETFFGAKQQDPGIYWELYQINPDDPENGYQRSMTWRSKVILTERPINYACAQVEAEEYPFLFTLYADGLRVHHGYVKNREVFRLPGGFKAREYQFEIYGRTEVKKICMAESVMELADS